MRWHLGIACGRQNMAYKFCCGNHSVFVYWTSKMIREEVTDSVVMLILSLTTIQQAFRLTKRDSNAERKLQPFGSMSSSRVIKYL